MNKVQSQMCDLYFNTLFEVPVKPNKYPTQFAIITAYNPMNKSLSESENISRNKILEKELKQKYDWIYQINGFDKDTKHKENGFMFNAESLDEACNLGEKYSQDAIYFVIDSILYVSKCSKDLREFIKVGGFLARIC
ncbi:hypothetical protein LO80_01100 [Candidatus Francisella endociliophora]|uniref:DUF3293 domain-containing protein n=1 Tax=Candidatus Francisella endociliophora TaxID=653937 RepID=A0A097EMA9_9GAMM|nr:DUF3293 domain-containing protein [Francisella sp. FSC1006]AIT08706.1 hypothetical protein LO80_01100 [Francisella sp. FSC1006]